MDSGGYSGCSSPKSYSNLGSGSHTFQVRATDSAGNTDPSPASYSWTVDSTPPDTVIDSGPPNPTNQTSASFTFHSTESGSSFQCQLDSGGFSNCISPKDYNNVSAGKHIFKVKAIDPAGNEDPSPASYTWTKTFTEDPLPPDALVKEAHVRELREAINTLRSNCNCGLSPFSWDPDPTLTVGVTPIKAEHITDLRNALNEVYVKKTGSPANFPTDPGLDPKDLVGKTIKKAHIQEIRDAVKAVE